MKKASKSLSNPKYWIKLTRKVFIMGFVVSLGLMLWIQYEIINGYFLKKNLATEGIIDRE
jgi:hypothetical protein